MTFDQKRYDSSWDEDNEELWDKQYKEWKKRDWESWFNDNLDFPFDAKRIEDEDDTFFTPKVTKNPFRLGHTMKVTGIDYNDDLYGILVKVREGRKTGCVPLCDLEVEDKGNVNFWPVYEYNTWFANR